MHKDTFGCWNRGKIFQVNQHILYMGLCGCWTKTQVVPKRFFLGLKAACKGYPLIFNFQESRCNWVSCLNESFDYLNI